MSGIDQMEMDILEDDNDETQSMNDQPSNQNFDEESTLIDLQNLNLFKVCRTGDTDALKLLLRHPGWLRKLNSLDQDDLTPLHLCAKYNRSDAAQLLVDSGASVQTRGCDDTTPLHYCAIYRKFSPSSSLSPPHDQQDSGASGGGDQEAIAEVIQREELKQRKMILLFCKTANPPADINAKDRYGSTALHMASYKSNLASVKDLLECGADVNCQDNLLMTPLHHAATYGNAKICEVLLQNGADILATDKEKSTALHLASAEGHLEIMRMLIEEASHLSGNGDVLAQMVNARDCATQTPLHIAVDNDHVEEAQLLIATGARCDEPRWDYYYYPMHLAAQNGEIPMMELIWMEAKRQTGKSNRYLANVRSKRQQTPLHRAARFNRTATVQFLIEHKADINATDDDGFSPLLVAADKGNHEVIKVLLEAGADIMIMDNNSKSVLNWSVENESLATMELLLSYPGMEDLIDDKDNFGNTPLHIAARNGNLKILEILHRHNCKLNLKNEDEQTPLHLAARYGRTQCVRWFCEEDDDTVMDEDENSNTPLHLAASEGHPKAIQVLIKHQADVEARNMIQWTPLDCAAANGWVKAARVLLDAGSTVDPTDRSGITPLYLACKNNHPDTVKLLLDWDASVEVRAEGGKNPLDAAIEAGAKGCVSAILESHDWWEFALQNRTKASELDDSIVDSPIRKLIRRMPELSLNVFSNCVTTNGLAPDDENFEVTFLYEYIDDGYSMSCWGSKRDWHAGSSVDKASLSGSEGFTSSDVYEADSGHVKSDCKAYTENTEILIKNHPLSVMVQSESEHLLKHPLVTQLLLHKWNAFGRYVYYANLFQYIVFVTFMTGYITVTKPSEYWDTSQYATLEEYVRAGHHYVSPTTFRIFHTFGQWVIVFMCLVNILREIFQLFSKKRAYFTLDNLLEWILFVSALIFVAPSAFELEAYQSPNDWQWQVGAWAIFLTWINLILFIRKFPKFGIYVVMFTDIFRTFLNFFLVFMLFVIAFALGFFCLLQQKPEFSNVWYSMVKTSVMMIGEFEFTDLFWGEDAPPRERGWFNATLSFFVLFIIIMSIIIMNLLVGLAVDDIKEVQAFATLERKAMQIELALDIEQTVPEFLRRQFIIRSETIRPNRQRKWNIARRFFKSDQMDGPAIEKALRVDLEPVAKVTLKQEQMMSSLKQMGKLLKEVKADQDQMKLVLKQIAAQYKVDAEADDYIGEVNDDEN